MPTVTIAGATIDGDIELSGGKLAMAEGTVKGAINAVSGYTEGDSSITGGSFATNVTEFCADGKCAYKQADDTYLVKAHTVVVDEAVEETCLTSGLTEGSHCSNCEEVLVAQEFIPATGHIVKILDAVEATCTENGLTAGAVCTACDKVLVEQEIVPAKGHVEVVDEAVEPTCTETGLTEGKHCSVCNEILVAQQTVAAKGHSYVDVITPSSCTEGGFTTHTCSVCGDVVIDSYTEAAGHEIVELPAVAPTCTETGLTAGTKCTTCDKILIAQEIVPAKGHVVVVDPAVAATCTEAGLTAGAHCSICTEVLVAQEVVEATGHDYANVVTEPTCTEKGYTTHVCANCGDIVVDTYVDAKGHVEVIDEAVEPTCTATGLTEGKHCSVCNEILVAQETVAAKGHSYEAVVTAPTCTEMGFTTHTCAACGDTYVDTYVNATGHTTVVLEAVEPTCTETGLTAGAKCATCGEILVAQEIIPAKGHALVEHPFTAPAEGQPGNIQYWSCEVCGACFADAEGTEEIDPASVIIPATAMKGDPNNNGAINIVDAQVIYDAANGKYADEQGNKFGAFPLFEGWNLETLLWVLDFNSDGEVDAPDAFAVQYFIHFGA